VRLTLHLQKHGRSFNFQQQIIIQLQSKSQAEGILIPCLRKCFSVICHLVWQRLNLQMTKLNKKLFDRFRGEISQALFTIL
jgi:hypothetical protein